MRSLLAVDVLRAGFWKRGAIALVWLIVAVFIAHTASLVRQTNIVFIFDAEKAEFFQVYYPVNENPDFEATKTERYAYDGGSIRNVAFLPPSPLPPVIRLDPSDDAARISLRRVEITSLFAKAELRAEELSSRLRTFQSVDQVEIRDGRLVINANGADPILTMDLSGLTYHFSALTYVFFVTLFALVGFTLHGAPLSLTLRRRIAVFSVPLIFSIVVTFVFFPGYMSYDSLHALRGARYGVVDSAWPPLVSYVWRAVDAICAHPSAMLFSQVLLLFTASSVIVFHYTGRVRYVALSLCATLLVPVVLGTVAAIWKDVLMASFFLAAFAVTLQVSRARSYRQVFVYASIATIFLFLGTAARHNAITATLPLALYLSWETVRMLNIRRKVAMSGALAVLGVALIFGAKLQLDRYSLPEFKRIEGMTDLVPVVRTMDLIAASICADENLLKDVAPGLTLEDMQRGYDARHSLLSMAVLNKVPSSADIDAAWFRAMKDHPICFWSNKVQLTAFLTGAHIGEQFLDVSPEVNSNEFGYGLPRSNLRTLVEDHIRRSSGIFFLRPWFLYTAATAFMIFTAYQRRYLDGGVLALWLSSVCYAGGLVMFGNAADARLLFYTNFSMILLPFILISRGNERVISSEERNCLKR